MQDLQNDQDPRRREAAWVEIVSVRIGGDLLSQAVSHQVPSALKGLTALFGMGRGVSPSLLPPKTVEPAEANHRPEEDGMPRHPARLENCTQANEVKKKNVKTSTH